tara:strand:+ start:13641 stop:13814 length:174 start_codon:yes stop_codon:yes gene_type:complete
MSSKEEQNLRAYMCIEEALYRNGGMVANIDEFDVPATSPFMYEDSLGQTITDKNGDE